MVKALEKMLTAIQTRSEEITCLSEDPALIPFLRAARAAQIQGMLELVDLLSKTEIQIPALLVASLEAEMGRVSE